MSTITLEFKGGIHRFTGSVASASKVCVNVRDVMIFKDKRGIDPVVAETKTSDTGRFSVAPKRVQGHYYATVVESSAGKYGRMVTCGAAQSKVVRIS